MSFIRSARTTDNSDMSMRIYSSARIAENPMLAVRVFCPINVFPFGSAFSVHLLQIHFFPARIAANYMLVAGASWSRILTLSK